MLWRARSAVVTRGPQKVFADSVTNRVTQCSQGSAVGAFAEGQVRRSLGSGFLGQWPPLPPHTSARRRWLCCQAPPAFQPPLDLHPEDAWAAVRTSLGLRQHVCLLATFFFYSNALFIPFEPVSTFLWLPLASSLRERLINTGSSS